MVATIDSERTTSKQNNKVAMTISVSACIGALVALIWLAVVTNNLNDTRAKLDTTQAATRTLQLQVYDLTRRTQGHESMLNTPQMQHGASGDAVKPMQGMPGMDMPMPGMGMSGMNMQPMQQSPQQSTQQQPMQQPAQQPGGGAMPQQGMGHM